MKNPISSSAIQVMSAGRWNEARALWQARLENDEPLSATDLNAYARTLECLAQWTSYQETIERGLAFFPDDRMLQIRRCHAQAIACMAEARWHEAWVLFERLRSELPQFEWPCAINYWSRQARYEEKLAALEDKQERLAALSQLSLFKASELMPQRAAGILQIVDCLDWPDSFQGEFRQYLLPLVECLRCHDQPIRLIKDTSLLHVVEALAVFWHKNNALLSELPAGVCEFFARLFLHFGWLDLYLQLRACFVSQLAAWSDERSSEAEFAYRVALANEQADAVRFASLKKLAPNRAEVQEYLNLSAAYHLKYAHTNPVKDEDRDFADYLEGRSIAIVGPVDVGLDSGAEIDGFDCIVRFNYQRGQGRDPVRFGSRTTISYYANMPALMTPPQELLAGLEELDYAMFLRRAWREYPWLGELKCRVRERPDHWAYLNNPMLVGYPNAVQRMLLDILRFKPSRIKIFCADMYTSMSYCSEYLRHSYPGRAKVDMMPSFVLHDPVSNFLLMQRLLQVQHIEADDVLKEVVSWSVDRYMQHMRTVHPVFRRSDKGVA